VVLDGGGVGWDIYVSWRRNCSRLSTNATLIETEIAARDASNTANRLKAAAFPVIKTLEGFDVSASSIPQATLDYLSSLEWVRAQHNLAIVGRPGTGKSHTLIGLGHAAVHAGHKVRYFTAADLIDTLYRGLADTSGD